MRPEKEAMIFAAYFRKRKCPDGWGDLSWWLRWLVLIYIKKVCLWHLIFSQECISGNLFILFCCFLGRFGTLPPLYQITVPPKLLCIVEAFLHGSQFLLDRCLPQDCTSTSHPSDITHLIGVPRPSVFFTALPLPWTQTKEQNRRRPEKEAMIFDSWLISEEEGVLIVEVTCPHLY